jgi:hypothetical protein
MPYFESLYPDDSFFSQIEEIIKFLKQGNSCQIIGLPGVGKSNLLRLLAYNRNVRMKHFGSNQKYVHFVYMNFSEVQTGSLLEVNKYLFLSLADSLRDRDMEIEHKKIHKIFKDHLSLNDDMALFQGLKEAISYLAIEKKLSVVFLFDRFKEYLPLLTNEFFANLRILRNMAKYRFAVIFALGRSLEDTLDTKDIPHFYEFLAEKVVYLPLTDKPSLGFRLSYLEKQSGKKLENELVQEVFNLTDGHNNLTKLSFENLLEENGKIENLGEYLIEKASIKSMLFEIWEFLNSLEKEQIVKGDALENLKLLTGVGLINNGKIAIPLFNLFIKKGLYENQETKKIMFDKDTKQIKLDTRIISDELTSLELNLLRFLIENEGKILTRDAIIAAVWKDSASTAGVTDQALDQLIFRLRKKIEQDLNSPRHILSVKGRGLIFKS